MEQLPLQYTIRVVEIQDAHGDSADVGQGPNDHALQSEVISPMIRSGIEKAAEGSCARHDRTDIASFGAIAERAGKGQIF